MDGKMDFGDVPRSKNQVMKKGTSLGVLHKSAPSFEVEAILAYYQELEDKSILWYHSDVPHDLWVLGTKEMEDELKTTAESFPISIDPSFNFGAFEVTPVTYRHPFIESKSKNLKENWRSALMIGPTILHHEKTEDTFVNALVAIAGKTKLRNFKFGVITDGEVALINASKNSFPKSIDLRCTKHFLENCKNFLKSNGIRSEHQQAPLIDVVFGEDGLIESNDKKDLKERLKNSEMIIGSIERELQQDKGEPQQSFYSYLKKNEKNVLRKLIRDRRREVGLHVNSENAPDRSYTNQSETTNSVLSAKKHSLGYTKKDDMNKGNFVKDVWQIVVTEQETEIKKALHGQSDCFRLKEEARYLEISTEK